MVGSVVTLALIALAVLGWYAWRARKRHFDERTPYIPSHPYADRNESYGGWDADAYDSGSPHASSSVPPVEPGHAPPPTMTQQPFGRR